MQRHRSVLLLAAAFAIFQIFQATEPRAGLYVTETSGTRWSDAAGVRWSDASGIRWSDASGIRWNDVGGVRWSDAAGLLFSDAAGVRWSDAAGVRWSDASAIEFTDPVTGSSVSIDLELLNALSGLPDTSAINVIVTYHSDPSGGDYHDLMVLGIPGGTKFRELPMVVVNATREQIQAIATLPNVRSIYSNRTLYVLDSGSGSLIGADEAASDPQLRVPGGSGPTGSGVTIATLDTGVDSTHPDLPWGTKVIENVRLNGGTGGGFGFRHPTYIEGTHNTDLVLGHGTFVASIAAGTGAASGGRYKGVAPGASILALSAGDFFIMNMLEGFDYLLDKQTQFNVRVVNCSWGTSGWFDPDDPVNIATRALYDRGITVVFAAGNQGPSPDTLNPYAVAPWVIGVGSTRKDGTLSDFSSRGIFEELLYHPVLVAPGEGIIAASPLALSGVYGVTGVADPAAGATVPPEHAAYYSVSSGTSFAAPHVAGAVAQLLEIRPDLTPAEIKQILQQSATPVLRHDRSEAGAGRLDLWAALTQARNPSRAFGTHVAGWLDERPFDVEHLEPSETEHFLPAGQTFSIPVTVHEDAVSWQMTLAWGDSAGSDDLDVTVRNGAGEEIGSSEAINGTSVFAHVEGVHLLGSIPQSMTVDVFFKGDQSLAGQSFYLRKETAIASAAYGDVQPLPAQTRAAVNNAVVRRIMIGRGELFEPGAGLTRAELARALALATELPQRIPGKPSFTDVPSDDPRFPYVETVAGDRARARLLEPVEPGRFDPSLEVSRLDFAVALVRAGGIEAEARARAGESLGLLDESAIADDLKGHVAVALERGLIAAVDGGGGPELRGSEPVTRQDAAGHLVALLDLRERPLLGNPASPASPPATLETGSMIPEPGSSSIVPSASRPATDRRKARATQSR